MKKRFAPTMLLAMVLVSLLSLIPLAVVANMIYLQSLKTYEASLIDTKRAQNDSFLQMLNSSVSLLRMQIYDLLADNIVTSIPVKYSTGSYDTTLARNLDQIKANLLSRQNYLPIRSSIQIYYPDVGRSVLSYQVQKCDDDTMAAWGVLLEQQDHHYAVVHNGEVVFWAGSPFSLLPTIGASNIFVTVTISGQSMTRYLHNIMGRDDNSSYAALIRADDQYELFAATSSLCEEILLANSIELPQADGYRTLVHEGQKFLLVWGGRDGLPFTVCQLTPLTLLMSPMEAYEQNFGSLLFVAIAVAVLFSSLMYAIVYRPILHARRVIAAMENGDMQMRMGRTWSGEFQHMYSRFDSMLEKIQLHIQKEYEFDLLNSRAELKQLQYQISPHFLYNTQFILQSLLMDENYEQAVLLTGLIGRYLQYITYSDNDLATLGEEVAHARDYANIQQIRFSQQLQVEFQECPPALQRVTVPRLILQPLLENAFEHGVRQRLRGGLIRVSFAEDGGQVMVMVEDNGDALSEPCLQELHSLLNGQGKQNSGIALYNINRRLQILYNDRGGLEIGRSTLGGLGCKLVFCGGEGHV